MTGTRGMLLLLALLGCDDGTEAAADAPEPDAWAPFEEPESIEPFEDPPPRCADNEVLVEYRCVCVPHCPALDCRPDGCGNTCGDCGPREEVCDGADDDCDGVVDEDCARLPEALCVADEECLPGQTCVRAVCVTPCQHNECLRGVCVEDFCLPTCMFLDCPHGCEDEMCLEAPEECADCPPDSFCYQNACRRSCADVVCPEGQACADGECGPPSCPGPDCRPSCTGSDPGPGHGCSSEVRPKAWRAVLLNSG